MDQANKQLFWEMSKNKSTMQNNPPQNFTNFVKEQFLLTDASAECVCCVNRTFKIRNFSSFLLLLILAPMH
jgi:hypothetical protein